MHEQDPLCFSNREPHVCHVMYTTCIAHAVSVTSRYQSNLGEEHWTSMKCILKYLRRTKDMLLIFSNGELLIHGYTDSNFISDIDDRKSTSGSLFVCNGGANN